MQQAQDVDPIGMGGQYGQNLIQNAQAAKKRDLQNAKTFTLPTSPRPPGHRQRHARPS